MSNTNTGNGINNPMSGIKQLFNFNLSQYIKNNNTLNSLMYTGKYDVPYAFMGLVTAMVGTFTYVTYKDYSTSKEDEGENEEGTMLNSLVDNVTEEVEEPNEEPQEEESNEEESSEPKEEEPQEEKKKESLETKSDSVENEEDEKKGGKTKRRKSKRARISKKRRSKK